MAALPEGISHTRRESLGLEGEIGMGSTAIISKGKGLVLAVVAFAFAASAAASYTSSVSSGGCQGSFHVFISFRGTDVRNTFLPHLLKDLKHAGIRAYVDTENLRKGDQIDPSLEEAIRNSRIAIVIFSLNYATSRWCLNELVQIMDRRKQGKIVVMPVFYRVEPRKLRRPTPYGLEKSLASHEAMHGNDSDGVTRWTKALSEAGHLSGWHLDANGNEAELISEIVKNIKVVLAPKRLHVAKYPVGIESRVAQFKNLLDMESKEVLFVGIWGMPGVGKTTLAKAVFNSVGDHFDGCAFLPNVRDDSANPRVGLAKLQEKLLSELFGRKDVEIGSVASGISRLKERLYERKVLLLLDNVNSREQLDALAGELDWFGNGSRILVTTRDKSLLTAHNVHVVHEVEGLAYGQALQLFSNHAFKGNDRPNDIAKDLVERCLAYCDGLPLALVVLGSLLNNQEERRWRSTMKLFEQQGPCREIDRVLRVSFDELDYNSRMIFLRIACRFRGKLRTEIEKAMDTYGLETSLGIDILIERSMITIVKDTARGPSVERVEMHPLLQLTGRNIACPASPDKTGKHSRMQSYGDKFLKDPIHSPSVEREKMLMVTILFGCMIFLMNPARRAGYRLIPN